jgi:phenylacetic acid degradation operon negative regulatory protein
MRYEVSMASHPLFRIVGRFKREPSRTGSLIVTFYGDAILPRGGTVWLGTLLHFLDLLDIDGGVVRTAVSRLAADGWLDRDKVGRKSYYKLAANGRERFESGVEHVYNPHSSDWGGRLELILIGNGADREASRAALSEAGFGNQMPGVWVAPSGVAVPSMVAGAIRLEVSADNEMGRRLIGESWSLERIAESYRDFLKTFAPLENWVAGADALSSADAMLARILLIHQYRRVILRDPLLPAALLPAAWPAPDARAFCGRVYRALLPASEHWLDIHGESALGKLPPPGPELSRRFPDPNTNMLQK